MKFSTVLELCFDRARGMFRLCSRYVSTMLEEHLAVLEVRGMHPPCSGCVPTVLDSYFDSA